MSFTKNFGLALTALAVGVASPAAAATVAGTYTTGGATTGTGPWTLTSTDSTFSVLRYVFNAPVAFGDLTSLSADYIANLGGIAGGSPRFALVTDANNDSVADGQIVVLWGPAGSFVDPTLGAANTGNLLALLDNGRYDLSGIGGSAYTDRATALSLASGLSVLRASLIVDSFGGADRNFTVNAIAVEAVNAVPEPATWAMMVLGFGAVGGALRARRKVRVAFA